MLFKPSYLQAQAQRKRPRSETRVSSRGQPLEAAGATGHHLMRGVVAGVERGPEAVEGRRTPDPVTRLTGLYRLAADRSRRLGRQTVRGSGNQWAARTGQLLVAQIDDQGDWSGLDPAMTADVELARLAVAPVVPVVPHPGGLDAAALVGAAVLAMRLLVVVELLDTHNAPLLSITLAVKN